MVSQQLRDAYAPRGRLRAALNHGNRVLVSRREDGTPQGITVDLASALAAALGVELDFVEYDRAVDVSNSATSGAWDICFLAVDPKRAETIDFTAPYVRIEGSYMAAPNTDYATSADLVNAGDPVGSVVGSAYSLTLRRLPGADHVTMYDDIFAMLSALDRGEVSAVAGIGSVMEKEAGLRPGARVLQPPFMEIRQAMAMPMGRDLASAHLKDFLADLLRSGALGEILERNGVDRTAAIVPA
ncbi:transporter substrate-binding domain-containing protein [Pseudooceanicola nitratireducens]|uniref:transporter substrate-binding domain-containing protein n=1 Tax=Pseudooceanicola nitratireducens TaxID=517719 RepID=UPI003109CF43